MSKSMRKGKRLLFFFFCTLTNYLNVFLSITKAHKIMVSINHSISQQLQKLRVNI